MIIRSAAVEDAVRISELIKNVARFFTLHPRGEGAEDFLKTIEPESIRSYITAKNFIYLVAMINEELAGVIAIRDYNHVYHLFVAPQYQRQGIAKTLWKKAKEKAISAGKVESFTVNSTLYAVPVYQRFGFKPVGPRVEKNGIAFIPMGLELNNDRINFSS